MCSVSLTLCLPNNNLITLQCVIQQYMHYKNTSPTVTLSCIKTLCLPSWSLNLWMVKMLCVCDGVAVGAKPSSWGIRWWLLLLSNIDFWKLCLTVTQQLYSDRTCNYCTLTGSMHMLSRITFIYLLYIIALKLFFMLVGIKHKTRTKNTSTLQRPVVMQILHTSNYYHCFLN